MYRLMVGLILVAIATTACSAGIGDGESEQDFLGPMEVGAIGKQTTLTQARLSAPYPVDLPRFTPEGLGSIHRVWTLGSGASFQVAVEWSDGTVMSIVPYTQEIPIDYARAATLVGSGETRSVRGGMPAYVRDARATEHGPEPAFLRWYDSQLDAEVTLKGPHTVEDLIAMAESI